jgi:hypothetical protein
MLAPTPSEALRRLRNSQATVVGQGVLYPIQESDTGGFVLASGDILVQQSLVCLIETGIYERPFQVRNGVPFGTRVPYMAFEDAERVRDLLTRDIERAISVWEPRVIFRSAGVVNPTTGSDPRYVGIRVVYTLRSTLSDDSVVANVRRGVL